MISTAEMSLALATTDMLNSKDLHSFQDFKISNAAKINKLHIKLVNDKTNFNAIGGETREKMLLNYATNIVYFNSLSNKEQNAIFIIAQRRHDKKNNRIKVNSLIGVCSCFVLAGALIAGNSWHKESNSFARPISKTIVELIS